RSTPTSSTVPGASSVRPWKRAFTRRRPHSSGRWASLSPAAAGRPGGDVRPGGPVVDPVPCSACGRLIDPLRAGHVAIFDLRFHFFCDRATCRCSFLGIEPGTEPEPEPLARSRLIAGLLGPTAPNGVQAAERPDLEAPILAAY